MARGREGSESCEQRLKEFEAFVGSVVDRLSGGPWEEVQIEVRAGDSHVSLRLRHRLADVEESRTDWLLATAATAGELRPGEKVPNISEADAVGALRKRIGRGDPEFASLVSNTNSAIVFKDEEGTGADRMMASGLKAGLDQLATLVAQEWTGVKLRVTEAWDEDGEHSPNSLHYEGRAADLTTHPVDGAKLGRLGRLAVDAGLDWVFFEDSSHIHVSVSA